MRKIDSIIERFVDDLLALVREATAERLAGLLAGEALQQKTRRPASKQTSTRRQRASGNVRAGAAPSRAWMHEGPGRGRPAPNDVVTLAADPAPPEASAEITNPQWLLAMGSPATSEVAEQPSVAAQASNVDEPHSSTTPEWDTEGPASTVRDSTSRSPVRLRENESLARVSGAGVVIRRAAR
jgi:hypothetical protein